MHRELTNVEYSGWLGKDYVCHPEHQSLVEFTTRWLGRMGSEEVKEIYFLTQRRLTYLKDRPRAALKLIRNKIKQAGRGSLTDAERSLAKDFGVI